MMSKRAFSTVACMNADVDTIIKACCKYGMDGIEIRLDAENLVLGKKGREELAVLGSEFAASGITVTNLGSNICIKKYDETHMQVLKKALESAVILKAKGIRVFLGNFSAKVNRELPKPDYVGIVRQLQEMCRTAALYETEIWVETHNEFAKGIVLKKLIQDVACDNLKIIWDIMHPIEDGEEIEETWDYIGDRIAHVHIKDGFDRQDPVWHDYQYTCLGDGSLPIPGILMLLRQVGYQGYLSFEWESAWRKELSGYDNSLDWVLTQFTEYLDCCEQNLITMPVSAWSRTDVSQKGSVKEFTVSAYETEASIDNRVEKACLKKYGIMTKLEPGKTYHLMVPYRQYDVGSRNLVYGMVTLYDAQGVMTRRIYLEDERRQRKELLFTAETENELLLELGIKRYGKAVFRYPLLREVVKPLSRKVRIASVFVKVQRELSYKAHLQRIAEGIDRAAKKGVDLVGLAENLNTRVHDVPEDEQFGTLDGMYCSMLREKAREHGCYIFCSFKETDEEGIRRNTAVLFGRKGEVVGKYYKSHITITEYEEGMIPGDSYPVFDTDFGRVGLLVCWDTYFPGPARAMAQQGAEILLIPTAGNPTYRHIARAKEHGVYAVVSCISGGVDSGIASTKIVDPCGVILAHTNEDGLAAEAVIELEEERHIFWLSVGAANAIPANIYRHEVRDDMEDMMK